HLHRRPAIASARLPRDRRDRLFAEPRLHPRRTSRTSRRDRPRQRVVPCRYARRARGHPGTPRLAAHRAIARPAVAPPHVYTIGPDQPFLTTLAQGLVTLSGSDPLQLPRMTVLLPTRRAVRSLREAFLRLTGEGSDPGAPLLLPRMRAIADLDDEGLAFGADASDGGGADDTLAVPPPIPELRRRLLLTELILEWSEREDDHALLPGQAAVLAGALARLLDAAASEGADFARLRDLAPEDLAEHWQTVLRFLEILLLRW